MGILEDLFGQNQAPAPAAPGPPPPAAGPQAFDPQMLAELLGFGPAAPTPAQPGPVDLDISQADVDAANSPRPTNAVIPPGIPLPKRQGRYDTAPEAVATANSMERLGAAEQIEANVKARQAAQGQAETQRGIDEQRAQFEANAKARQDRLAKIQAESDTLKTKIETFGNQSTDPGRVWKRMSTAGQVALGLQMAITGFLNPRNPEAVMGLMNHLVQDDLASQAQDHQMQAKSLEMLVGMNRTDEGRAEDAFKSDELLRATRWDFIKRQADLLGAQQTDEASKARAEVISQQAEVRRNQAIQKAAEERVKEQAAIERAGVPISVEKMRQTGDTVREGLKLSVGAVEKELDRNAKKGSGGVGGVPKGYTAIGDPSGGDDLGVLPNTIAPKAIEFVRNSTQASSLMQSILQRSRKLDEWSKRPDFLNLGSKDIHQISADYGKLRVLLKNMDGMGANFTALENELEKMQTGNGPDTWTTQDNTDRIEQALTNLTEQTSIAAHVLKISPWDPHAKNDHGAAAAKPGEMPSYMEKD
jgi:hypothetical protein